MEKQLKIKEIERFYGFCVNGENVRIEITADHLDKNSEYFTHSRVKHCQERYRTLGNHIAFYAQVVEGLKQLKAQLDMGEVVS